jgi:hypothetical protein
MLESIIEFQKAYLFKVIASIYELYAILFFCQRFKDNLLRK